MYVRGRWQPLVGRLGGCRLLFAHSFAATALQCLGQCDQIEALLANAQVVVYQDDARHQHRSDKDSPSHNITIIAGSMEMATVATIMINCSSNSAPNTRHQWPETSR